jgi:hypothetical protein
MIRATKYDITIYRGATFDLSLTWQDSNGNVFDLSSYTDAAMQIRLTPTTPDPPIISLTLDSGITLGSTAPNIVIDIDATTTNNITILTGVYDLILTDSSGVVTRLLEGKVKISPDVTRP